MAFPSAGIVHRSTVTGRRGMVASGHPLASLAGVRILMQGGNAIDAAVATAAALNVVEPYMSGLGGVGYMQIYNAATREHQILDYVGLTPRAAELRLYDNPDKQDRGPLSPLVPGSCGGWLEALRRYGRLDRAAIFAPAIEYAEQGYALTVKNSLFTESNVADLLKHSTGAAAYLHQGKAPLPGQVLCQPDLARTFRLLAEGGAEVFYRGEIAGRIARYMEETGGLLDAADLAAFAPAWLDPIHIDYRGYQVFVPPLPCQGIQYLLTLKILEGFDLSALGHNSAETLHLFLEAAKLAAADRIAYAAIPDPPLAGLLHPGYAAGRRQLIGPRAKPGQTERFVPSTLPEEHLAGDPRAWEGAKGKNECTTHFSAIDAEGNAVAVTQSLGSGFGSAMVVPGTGVALNNFMRWFDLEPGSPNAIGPSKKNEMCMSPTQVWDQGGLRLLIGTPGSYGILQTTPQMIMNVLDHGMNVQAAIEAPRVKATTGLTVDVETRIPAAVLAELEKRGHQLNRLGEWTYVVGGGQGIMVDAETGSFMGGADPRRDGYALGW
ncbi:MAG: gamma-glutamyltransferase [Candidatus Handelsmanbacteria bacterium]|nr:gamma-glutamyltransferase [Candidatus Handelsmanbacteria bacterium]